MFKLLHRAAFALLGFGLIAQPAFALPARIGQGLTQALPSGGRLVDGRITAAPNAFVTFCDSYSDQCGSTQQTGIQTLDAERWAELREINARVNRTITPHSDEPGTDVWTLDATAGDCDDYAVEKRKLLLEQGWPSSSLSLTVAFVPSGEAHLLLTVRTDRGDFVLDNLSARVISADRIGYRWVARQSTLHPRLWVRIGGTEPEPIREARVHGNGAVSSASLSVSSTLPVGALAAEYRLRLADAR